MRVVRARVDFELRRQNPAEAIPRQHPLDRLADESLGCSREHFSGIRAHAFRPAPPVTWAGWSAWSRLAREEFGARLIRVKGLLEIEDSIAFVQGVQGVFHPPQRFKEWPDEDHGNRLVCISRDIPEEDIALTLPALNAPAGTQAIYSRQELRERQ